MGQTRVNPAVNELRQHRLAQLRLLGAIEMVDVYSAKRRSSTPTPLVRDEGISLDKAIERARLFPSIKGRMKAVDPDLLRGTDR